MDAVSLSSLIRSVTPAAAAARNGLAPHLSCVRLWADGQQFCAECTNLDTYLCARSSVAPGSELPPTLVGRDLERLLSHLHGDVRLEQSGTDLVIRSNRSRYQYPTLPPDSFPRIDHPSGADIVMREESSSLRRRVRQVACVAERQGESQNPALSCIAVYIKTGELVAMDRHRFTRSHRGGISWDADRGGAVLVPAESLQTAVRFLPDGDVTVLQDPRGLWIMADGGNYVAMVRAVKANPIEWASGLVHARPKDPSRCVPVPRKALLDAICRCEAVWDGNSPPVILLSPANGGLMVSLQPDKCQHAAEELVETDWPQDWPPIAMQARYVRDAIAHLDTAQVSVHIAGSTMPVWWTAEGENEAIDAIIMPILQ